MPMAYFILLVSLAQMLKNLLLWNVYPENHFRDQHCLLQLRKWKWRCTANFHWIPWHNFHTMDLLWEKFQWILPLYMKPISFQSNASVVCSLTATISIGFCLKKLNVFSQHIGKKNKCISEFRRTNPQELKCWSTFCVFYFLGYYLMMQHQHIVKRVNGTHELAHRSYQLLSAPYHCCLYKHRRQDERQPPQSSWPVPICT